MDKTRVLKWLVLFAALLALAVAWVPWDRSPSAPELVPVVGRLTLDGQPLGGAGILFIPGRIDGRKPGLPPVSLAFSDPSGRFAMVALDSRPGAVVGKHLVVVSQRRGAPDPGEGSAPGVPSAGIPGHGFPPDADRILASGAGGGSRRSAAPLQKLLESVPVWMRGAALPGSERLPSHLNRDSAVEIEVGPGGLNGLELELKSRDPWALGNG